MELAAVLGCNVKITVYIPLEELFKQDGSIKRRR